MAEEESRALHDWAWIFHSLWAVRRDASALIFFSNYNDKCSAPEKRAKIPIPDTIMLNERGEPSVWYFTSKV